MVIARISQPPLLIALAKLTAVVEPVEGDFSTLAHLDEAAVGVTHVAAPFPAVIVEVGLSPR